jgi:hypothetical protein
MFNGPEATSHAVASATDAGKGVEVGLEEPKIRAAAALKDRNMAKLEL